MIWFIKHGRILIVLMQVKIVGEINFMTGKSETSITYHQELKYIHC